MPVTTVPPPPPPRRKWSWELPVGSVERLLAERDEAGSLGMPRRVYVNLPLDERKAKFVTAELDTQDRREDIRQAIEEVEKSQETVGRPMPETTKQATGHLLTSGARFVAVAIVEFGVLRFIEQPPLWFAVATVALAVLFLLLLENREHVRALASNLFGTLLVLLFVAYGGTVLMGLIEFGIKSGEPAPVSPLIALTVHPKPPQIVADQYVHAEHVIWGNPQQSFHADAVPAVVYQAEFATNGELARIFVEYSQFPCIFEAAGRIELTKVANFVHGDQVRVPIIWRTSVGPRHDSLNWASIQANKPDAGLPFEPTSYCARIMVLTKNAEQHHYFMIMPTLFDGRPYPEVIDEKEMRFPEEWEKEGAPK